MPVAHNLRKKPKLVDCALALQALERETTLSVCMVDAVLANFHAGDVKCSSLYRIKYIRCPAAATPTQQKWGYEHVEHRFASTIRFVLAGC